ncbi:MAG: TetR family transcriptional regulator [Deltaproteobacteria bacterium]|nr:TetR family transcriptional regulator [Deltaproteobacteria bacterium]
MTSRDAPRPGRRVPTQARSRARYDRILEAAAEEFAARGVDASTVDDIAARAGTSVGSVYQFFPNKQALYGAIASRYLARARELFEHWFSVAMAPEGPPWEALVDLTVDAFAALDRDGPAFRAIWGNLPHAAQALGEAYAINREIAARVALLLERHAPTLHPARRDLVATTVVETMTALLFVAARAEDPPFSDAMVAEAKVLLKRYLAPYARGAEAPRDPGTPTA